MSKSVAIVTGGAGFIGSHMVDLLIDSGFVVRVIDNLSSGHPSNLEHRKADANLEFVFEDIRSLQPGSALFKDTRYVFHFAGMGDIIPSIENPVDYMNVNVQGTIKVLECARVAGIQKFLYASSSSCYGLAETPTDELHPIEPEHPYALSKYQGEQVAFHWHKVYDVPVNAVCIFNAYGPRVRTTGAYGAVFGVFFKQKLVGKPFTVVGDGTQSRDFIYVTDVTKAFLAAAVSPISGERFNVGAGKPQSINYLVGLIGGEVVYVPKRPGEPDVTFANIKKITSQLGWRPQMTFEEGVNIMMKDIERWRNAPLWESESIALATENWFRYLGKEKYFVG